MGVTSTTNAPGLLTPSYSRSKKMPIPGARFRVHTTKTGKKVRLAFKDGNVVESKNLATGATHTPSEFSAERARRTARNRERTIKARHRGQVRAAQSMGGANG